MSLFTFALELSSLLHNFKLAPLQRTTTITTTTITTTTTISATFRSAFPDLLKVMPNH